MKGYVIVVYLVDVWWIVRPNAVVLVVSAVGSGGAVVIIEAPWAGGKLIYQTSLPRYEEPPQQYINLTPAAGFN